MPTFWRILNVTPSSRGGEAIEHAFLELELGMP
jgi:hypothetical protein